VKVTKLIVKLLKEYCTSKHVDEIGFYDKEGKLLGWFEGVKVVSPYQTDKEIEEMIEKYGKFQLCSGILNILKDWRYHESPEQWFEENYNQISKVKLVSEELDIEVEK